MTESQKKDILSGYKQQFEALCSQRGFASDMLQYYANSIKNLEFSSFVGDELFNLCRQYVKFYELYKRVSSDVDSCSAEIDAIKKMK